MINTNLINDILKQYSIQRSDAILKCEAIKDELNKEPEYYALEKDKKALIFEKGKAIFEQKNTKTFDEKIKKIANRQAKILEKLGYTKDSLVPHFSCGKCEDTGFVSGELCSCVKQKYNNALMEQSQIDFKDIPLLSDYDTSIFDEEEKPHVQLIKKNLSEFVSNFNETRIKNIVLVGSTGVGKTYLAQSVAKEIIKNGHTALFCSSFEVNKTFLTSHISLLADKLQGLSQLIEPELLIIDDFGSEPILKNVTCEYYLILINERNLQNKSTIFTTNLMPNSILDKYNERVFSRMFNKSNSITISMTGADLRLKK